MSLRTALIASIVLGLGGLGLVGWIAMQLPAKPPIVTSAVQASAPRLQVLVAAHPLRAGSLLKFDDIQPREMPAAETPPGHFGLRGLAERIVRLGGLFSVNRREPHGVSLVAEIPLAGNT